MEWTRILNIHPQGNKILLAYAAVGRSPIYNISLFRYKMWLRCIVALFKPVINVAEFDRQIQRDTPNMVLSERMEMINDVFHYKHGIIVDRSQDLIELKQRLYVEGLQRGKPRDVMVEQQLLNSIRLR